MGQKVNPHGLRVGVIKDWDSKWYAEADFADNLVEDYKIRTYLKKRLYSAGVSDIEIERASDRVKIIIHTAKPGVVIGKGGSEIEKLKAEVQKLTDKKLLSFYPGMDWKGVMGMRDIIAHHYFDLDAEIVYDVIKHDLPKLKDVLQQIVDDLKVSNQAID